MTYQSRDRFLAKFSVWMAGAQVLFAMALISATVVRGDDAPTPRRLEARAVRAIPLQQFRTSESTPGLRIPGKEGVIDRPIPLNRVRQQSSLAVLSDYGSIFGASLVTPLTVQTGSGNGVSVFDSIGDDYVTGPGQTVLLKTFIFVGGPTGPGNANIGVTFYDAAFTQVGGFSVTLEREAIQHVGPIPWRLELPSSGYVVMTTFNGTSGFWWSADQVVIGGNDAGSMVVDGATADLLGPANPNIMAFELRGPTYVDANATGPVHDGSSWCTAFTTLDEALAVAPLFGVIALADGTYAPDPTGLVDPRDATFRLINELNLQGGFAGCGAVDPDERDVALFETILSCDLNGDDGPNFTNNGENCYHVVIIDEVDSDPTLDGLTITGANANGTGTNNTGGGILIDNAFPWLTDCRIVANSAGSGGGVQTTSSSPTFVRCVFDGNTAGAGGAVRANAGSPFFSECSFDGNAADFGGALDIWPDTSPTIENCTLSDNSANIRGGAMVLGGPTALVAGCSFTQNTSVDGGGAIWFVNVGSPVLSGCTFDGNTAGWGGALEAWGGASASVEDCVFSNNSSANRGGAAIFNGPTASLARCSFTQNTSSEDGGAIWVQNGGDLTLADCVFDGNSCAAFGGGAIRVWSSGSVIQATNCDFTNNTANGWGGGVAFSTANATLTDCLFSGNTAIEGAGGGADFFASDLQLTRCTFTGNSAKTSGGGVYNNQITSGLYTDCTFTANSADFAGGLDNLGSAPIVTNCDFNGNVATFRGGAVVNFSGGSAIYQACRFVGNTSELGGAMINDQASPSLINCAFSGNVAADGGGVYTFAETTLDNCTFSRNTATSAGGGILNNAGNPWMATNCIFWNNSDNQGTGSSAQIQDNTGAVALNHSLIQGGWSGAGGNGILINDPLFVDADGVDDIVGTEDDDLRLGPCSPAINSGDNAAVPAGVTTDLDGNPRIASATVDFGPYENQSGVCVLPDADGDGVCDACDICPGADDNDLSVEFDCNGVPDACEGFTFAAPSAEDPLVSKNRYLTITPGNAGYESALRVTFVDLPADYAIWNGRTMWVTGPKTVTEQSGSDADSPAPTFTTATLSCQQDCRDWGTLGQIDVFAEGIVPGGAYEVQALICTCDSSDEAKYSSRLQLSTGAYGDVVGQFDSLACSWTAPNGVVGIPFDTVADIDKFRNVPCAPRKARADLVGVPPNRACVDQKISVSDYVSTLDGFRGTPYPFSPTDPDPCNALPCPNP